MKRFISIFLILAIALSFAACGGAGTTTTEPTETKPAVQKDDGVLRILLFGHSLGNDSVHKLPDVFAKESPDTKFIIGYLYYSGCPVYKHVEYAENESRVYAYMEFDSEKDTYTRIARADGTFEPLTGVLIDAEKNTSIAQTSLFALQQHDWDIIVTQGYPWEVTNVPGRGYDALTTNYTKLQQYMLDNDIDKETTPKFGWNMVWSFPDDDDLIRPSDREIYNNFFGGDVKNYYTQSADVVKNVLMPKFKFDYLMPASTAYINALSGYKTTKEMYRDYAHASDFGQAMIAYLWYCTLTGTDIADCKFLPINYQYLLNTSSALYLLKQDWTLTDEEKQTIIEVVGNAIANPYEITPKSK